MRIRRDSPARSAMVLACALCAAGFAACSSGGSGTAPATTTAAPSTSSAAPAAPRTHRPRRTDGSAVALSTDGKQLFVADEDHEVVFVAPASFAADLSGVRVVPMPGPPAQVVVADDLVLVTVRTLPSEDAKAARAAIRGPLPEASKVRRLATSDVWKWDDDLSPAEYEKFMQEGELGPRFGGGKPSASAAASASEKPKDPPAAPKAGTPSKPFDPAVVRKSQGGLLLVMKPDAERGLVETGRVVLPPDAWGLGVTPDGMRAVVTSAWTNRVSVVDIDEKKVIATLPVPREPRGVAMAKDGKTAYVSHLVGTDLTRIDGVDGAPKTSPLPLPAGRSRTSEKGPVYAGSLGWSLTLSPDGKSLFAPRHAIGAAGGGAWWGAPVVDVLSLESGKPVAPFLPNKPVFESIMGEANLSGWGTKPGEAITVPFDLVQPRAVVYRAKTNTLLVAAEGFSKVVEMDALVPDPTVFKIRSLALNINDRLYRTAIRGGSPAALALSEDEDSVYVYCRTTFDLVQVELTNRDNDVARTRWLRLAEDFLPTDAARGRFLYATANDDILSDEIGCEACHPEGRDDGYVWREGLLDADKSEEDAVFVGLRETSELFDSTRRGPEPTHRYYPRQTPMIAGRARSRGPYGWHAEAPTMVERLTRAVRLHRGHWNFERSKIEPGSWRPLLMFDNINDFLQSGLMPPPTLDAPLTDVQKRGKAIFESAEAQCAKCHVPDSELTDRTAYPLRALPVLPGFDEEKNTAFKTPSLYFIAGTAPYFHDGSAATLADLVKNNGSRMGQTAHLNPEDQAALVAYLETL